MSFVLKSYLKKTTKTPHLQRLRSRPNPMRDTLAFWYLVGEEVVIPCKQLAVKDASKMSWKTMENWKEMPDHQQKILHIRLGIASQ